VECRFALDKMLADSSLSVPARIDQIGLSMNIAALLRALCVGAGIVLGAQPAAAQTYPSKPVTIVVSFAAGGFVDTIARLVGQKLTQRFGQPFIIENRPGAAGNIAHRFVAKATPDGYTLLATSTAIAINETLYKTPGYHGADFTPVAIFASTPEILANNVKGPATLAEVVAQSKVQPTNFGTAGTGSASYIVTEYFFKQKAKIQATHVPFQGGAPLLNAILSNHIDLAATALAGGFVPHITSGALHGLAVASEKRFPLLPSVPTYSELGYPGFTALSWAGLFAPANAPHEIVEKLNAAIEEIMKEPEIVARITPVGYEPLYGSPAEAAALYRNDIAKWREMVEVVGLRIE
jgi:tripartite-type tricarboxylate transporter receptor subunit TctC